VVAGELHAPLDVGKRVFGARSLPILFALDIPRVVKQGGDAQIERESLGENAFGYIVPVNEARGCQKNVPGMAQIMVFGGAPAVPVVFSRKEICGPYIGTAHGLRVMRGIMIAEYFFDFVDHTTGFGMIEELGELEFFSGPHTIILQGRWHKYIPSASGFPLK
jgi:hypothetical protein